MAGPRSYTPNTLKRLFALSGNQCAFPGCALELVNESNAANSNICHIEAAEPGGQRYNPSMSPKQRADYHNLILLCQSHHNVTNNETIFTVEKLREMKSEHATMIQRRISAKKPLQTRPSLLADVVKRLCKVDFENDVADSVVQVFDIDEKIKYNSVIQYRPFIEEHRVYAGKLHKIYAEFEKAGNGNMNNVLRTIASLYAKQKGKILGVDLSLANIQKNADALFEAVERELHDRIDSSLNNDPTIPYEDVEFGLSIILVDAFMRCKILEEPK
jgi:hypothetical protein